MKKSGNWLPVKGTSLFILPRFIKVKGEDKLIFGLKMVSGNDTMVHYGCRMVLSSTGPFISVGSQKGKDGEWYPNGALYLSDTTNTALFTALNWVLTNGIPQQAAPAAPAAYPQRAAPSDACPF